MAAHYCINCPRCRRGCSICRRCACSAAELDEVAQQYFKLQPFVIPALPDPDEEPSKPETD